MGQIFCVRHWGSGGTGSGYTIVVASSERMAREMVKQYLLSKPEGYKQYTRLDLFEVETLEDSPLGDECFAADESGVKAEYWLKEGEHHIQLIYLGCDVEALAAELDELQARFNDGRGVSCVRGIVFSLRRGELGDARACANNESDKIRSYKEIVAVLKRVGLWSELRWLRGQGGDEA
jgi:hypothetical protein